MQRSHKQSLAGGRVVKIGTRGSPLALWQARHVQQLLGAALGVNTSDLDKLCPVVTYTTSGDKLKGELKDFGGKGLFTKELEGALLSGDVDIAVHSMKDVPTQTQAGLVMAAILEREDPRDGFISDQSGTLMSLPQGAVIGTASIRRRAQVLALRPDIRFTLLRGNVGTRLEKMRRGDCAATFLAVAGLKRLGQEDVITEAMSSEVMLSAPAQGAIGVECRAEDAEMRSILETLNHRPTEWAITAERSFLKALDGSCRTPIAALATLNSDTLHFRGEVLSMNGSERFIRESRITCSAIEDAQALGFALGQEIKAEIGERVLWDED